MVTRITKYLRYGLLLPLVVFSILSGIGVVYIFNGFAANTWDTTQGRIVQTGFPVTYEFSDQNNRIRRETIRHSFISSSAEALAARYPVGTSVEVRYCVSDGTVLSVLEPGIHLDSACLTLLFLVLAWLYWKGFQPVLRLEHG